MTIFLLIITSILILFIAGNAFYVTFKKYEEDDDFIFSGITFIEFIFTILLFISEKLAPKKYHTMFFKISSFLVGLFFLGFAGLLWMLLI